MAFPEEVKRQAVRRLDAIEGQIKGLKKMILEDRYCIEVLTQISSVHEALRGVGKLVMRNYLEGCATRIIRSDEPEKAYDEIMDVIYKFVK